MARDTGERGRRDERRVGRCVAWRERKKDTCRVVSTEESIEERNERRMKFIDRVCDANGAACNGLL